MNRIVWLASYPKSGNTWVRILLANYIRNARRPVDINDLGEAFSIASSRRVFDRWSGVESSALDHATVDRLRPELYRRIADAATGPLFIKVHDGWQLTPDGEPLFPPEATAAVVYLVRDPRDVAPSLAAHLGVDTVDAVSRMCDPEASFGGGFERLHDQLRQFTGSWSDHAQTWVDASPPSCHIVRYEDLRQRTEAVFGDLVQACGLPRDRDRIARAVRFSEFSELRRQETENGFGERHPRSRATFFRSGRVGSWRGELAGGLAERIRDAHGPMMHRFGYQ